MPEKLYRFKGSFAEKNDFHYHYLALAHVLRNVMGG
jgi:hypothetical protein